MTTLHINMTDLTDTEELTTREKTLLLETAAYTHQQAAKITNDMYDDDVAEAMFTLVRNVRKEVGRSIGIEDDQEKMNWMADFLYGDSGLTASEFLQEIGG